MTSYNDLFMVFAMFIFGMNVSYASLTDKLNTAKCRARCLDQFATAHATDEECDGIKNCSMCWNVCEMLEQDFFVWHYMCGAPEICQPGCEIACDFWLHDDNGETESTNPRFFIAEPEVMLTSDQLLYLNWEIPILKNADVHLYTNNSLVYVLRWRDTSENIVVWNEMVQTATTETSISMSEFATDDFNKFEFKLLALDSNGTSASLIFKPEVQIIKDATIAPAEQVLDTSDIDTESIFNVTVVMESKNDAMYAIIKWTQDSNKTEGNTPAHYSVYWGFNTCNVDETMPYCDLPPEWTWKPVTATQTEIKVTIGPLLYNTEYWTEVELDHDKMKSDKVKFYTPACLTPNQNFTMCITSQRPQSEVQVEPVWFIEALNQTYDISTGQVMVPLSWLAPEQQPDHYIVAWYGGNNTTLTSQSGQGSKITEDTNITLALQNNAVYNIRVIAVYKSEGFENKSDWFKLNVSAEIPDIDPIYIPVSQATDNSLTTTVVSICSVAVIIVALIIIVVVYRRCCGFNTVIVRKASLAMSNSYQKGPQQSTMDLMAVQDQWELNPKDIKFGSHLGQGAFGKVLTGTCNGKKVAIKVVKGTAPLAYKEDLLAEISLMKKIGNHPNIVSMIGACTLNEPVALVMEYVPNGNLQNFLRMCRMEGRFSKENGYHELAYNMVNEQGKVVSGTITPRDMLSFARQVTLAMEYLAEKSYVHRDLAARNVLVGHNKVVKVCDFGLSRDIYKDHEYHKLGNGKLPLKWMALESLRDRIFTTQSDVWSFGILMWEIVTMGASPYSNVALADLYHVLESGYRMDKPSNCQLQIYDLILKCWSTNPRSRPTFTELRTALENMMSEDSDYLELENIDVPLNDSDNSISSENIRTVSVSMESETESGIVSQTNSNTESTDNVSTPQTPNSAFDSPKVHHSFIFPPEKSKIEKSAIKAFRSRSGSSSSFSPRLTPKLSLKGSFKRTLSLKFKDSKSQENLLHMDHNDDHQGEQNSMDDEVIEMAVDYSDLKKKLKAMASSHF